MQSLGLAGFILRRSTEQFFFQKILQFSTDNILCIYVQLVAPLRTKPNLVAHYAVDPVYNHITTVNKVCGEGLVL